MGPIIRDLQMTDKLRKMQRLDLRGVFIFIFNFCVALQNQKKKIIIEIQKAKDCV